MSRTFLTIWCNLTPFTTLNTLALLYFAAPSLAASPKVTADINNSEQQMADEHMIYGYHCRLVQYAPPPIHSLLPSFVRREFPLAPSAKAEMNRQVKITATTENLNLRYNDIRKRIPFLSRTVTNYNALRMAVLYIDHLEACLANSQMKHLNFPNVSDQPKFSDFSFRANVESRKLLRDVEILPEPMSRCFLINLMAEETPKLLNTTGNTQPGAVRQWTNFSFHSSIDEKPPVLDMQVPINNGSQFALSTSPPQLVQEHPPALPPVPRPTAASTFLDLSSSSTQPISESSELESLDQKPTIPNEPSPMELFFDYIERFPVPENDPYSYFASISDPSISTTSSQVHSQPSESSHNSSTPILPFPSPINQPPASFAYTHETDYMGTPEFNL